MKKAVFNPDEWNTTVASSAKHTDVEALVCAVEAAGIDPGRRAETLTVEEFGRIANETADE